MPRREAEVLRRHHGGGETLAAIAESMGVTRERVRQLALVGMEMARAIGRGDYGGSMAGARKTVRLRLGREVAA